MIIQHCETCGQKLKKIVTDRHDPSTGKRIVVQRCVNPVCEWGICPLTGKSHEFNFGLHSFFGVDKCRCGIVFREKGQRGLGAGV